MFTVWHWSRSSHWFTDPKSESLVVTGADYHMGHQAVWGKSAQGAFTTGTKVGKRHPHPPLGKTNRAPPPQGHLHTPLDLDYLDYPDWTFLRMSTNNIWSLLIFILHLCSNSVDLGTFSPEKTHKAQIIFFQPCWSLLPLPWALNCPKHSSRLPIMPHLVFSIMLRLVSPILGLHSFILLPPLFQHCVDFGRSNQSRVEDA